MAEHDHTDPPSDPALRVKALESLLVEKGIIDSEVVGAFADYYEHRVGPRNGAKVVAHAWSDPAYKQRLLSNGTAAIAELSFGGLQGEEMVVAREHADSAQRRDLHALLLLPLADAWATADLV